jgi:hypothetical protein
MTTGANHQLPTAAMMPISTANSGPASLASTVARAGAWPAGTQASDLELRRDDQLKA